jgi:allophanate hydrolase subunit 2
VPGVDVAPVRPISEHPVLRVVPGPRADWFSDDALAALGTTGFEVTSHSDRVGVRLAGAALVRRRHEELPSEGVVEGAVQVPADGQPVVFLADHPVTGGYPVVAVVHPDDIAVAAQLRPGRQVRFALQPALG